jgi:hypothetical protein
MDRFDGADINEIFDPFGCKVLSGKRIRRPKAGGQQPALGRHRE